MRRYRVRCTSGWANFATLITGPSGTGKELVGARPSAESPYLRFDERRMAFPDDEGTVFFPINISALSPALVESGLFGHRPRSFTGAVGDRKGGSRHAPRTDRLSGRNGRSGARHSGELLRVIETRRFNPVGDTASLRFRAS